MSSNDFLDKLNDRQKEAVQATEGAVLMLAGAGSGKTSALTCRVAQIINEGVSPYEILAITFTNKAAREMRERVAELVGENARFMLISTFHSACVRFLRRDITELGLGYTTNFTIYDSDDQKAVIKECCARLSIDEKTFKPGKLLAQISSQKDELISCIACESRAGSDYYKQIIARVYSLYQSLLRKNNALDFDDLIFLTVKLFKENQRVLARYQERFKYILVDEYQDTNTAQYELIKTLSGERGNLCVVGDDDQSIYGWRGANIQNIYNFEKDFPNTKVIKLEQNYRSTQNILDAANAVIVNNFGRKSKKLWTNKEEGPKIKLYAAENEAEEAQFVVKTIIAANGNPGDYAVLYRTNAQSRILEDAFVKKNVPYRIYGGLRFYERREIKDILAYLRLLVNPSDNISARRIINVPKRGAGKAFIDKVDNYADERNISFYEALKTLSNDATAKISKKIKDFLCAFEEISALSKESVVVPIIEQILEKTGYLQMLESEGDEFESNSRIENINELISNAAAFERESEQAISLENFLAEVALVADVDKLDEGAEAVTLMTIHSAKGLEFPIVFLTGLEDGLFPSYMSINGGQSGIEEERRLFYVGVTRAERELVCTRAKSRMIRGFTEYAPPSRFLKEAPQNLFEHIKNFEKKPPKHTSGKTVSPKPSYRVNPADFANVLKPAESTVVIDFDVGDNVLHGKYGAGTVKGISPAGKDYEITVEFPDMGRKKFMAALSGLKRIQSGGQNK